MLRNNLNICEHCKSKESGYSGQSACTKIFLGNSSYTNGVMRSSALPSKRPPTLHHQPRTFDGGASPTLIQPAVSAGNQPPLVTFSMLAQSHSNKAGTPGDTTPCFLSSVSICTSSGSLRPLKKQCAVEVTMASQSSRFIRFVPAGTTLPLQSHQCRPLSSHTLLLQANDWEFLFDLDDQLHL